jgi:hypothetical protein
MIETEVNDSPAVTVAGSLGAVWGISGFSLLLGQAIVRLAMVTMEIFSQPLYWYHWLGLLLIGGLMAYFEGYRGFQKGVSPRVAARARYLAYHPKTLHVLLGPLFCIGYFYSSKRRKRVAISVTTGIIALILLVRLLEQPWRGIVDAGVVVGLTWGLVSLLIFSVLAFTQADFGYSPETPDEGVK